MILITASFTADPIIRPLQLFLDLINVESEIRLTPYAQVFQQLLDPCSLFCSNEQGVNILLIRLEDWLPSESEKHNLLIDSLNERIDNFLSTFKNMTNKVKVPLIIVLCRPSSVIYENTLLKKIFIRLEKEFQEIVTHYTGIYFISTKAIDTYYPVKGYHNSYANKIGHIPYTESYFSALAATVARKIHAIFQPTYKVIVLDCDNTLWEGICGEVENIADLKVTETQLALQRFIIEQQKIGMLICLCSKNNEVDVWSVFDKHPGMLIKRHHLASHRINWQEKTINISEVAEQLNLSLNSFIFIDDNSHECRAMQKAHPEVLTIQYKENIIHILQHIWCLDRLNITQEDLQRTTSYQQKVKYLSSNVSSLNQFINDLKLEVSLLPLSSDNPSEVGRLKRAAELTRKVNQFNCTTQRFTDKQLQCLLTGSQTCLVIHIKDKEKNYGLKGVLIYELKEEALEISNFLLSCEVLGRGAEHHILNEIGCLAKEHDVLLIKFQFISSDRNEPAEAFLTSVCGPAVKTDNGVFFNISTEKACSVNYEMTQQFVTAKKVKEIRKEINRKKVVIEKKDCIDYLRIAHDFSTVEQILYFLKNNNHRSFFTDSVLIAAKTPLEAELIVLWEESLNISNLSCGDNFTQLGGDSIKATLVLGKIYSIYNTELQISDLLNSTISKLATLIEEKEKNPTLLQQTTLQKREGELYPLSFAQQRLWFLDQLEPNRSLYNMFVVFELKGNLSQELLKQTFLVLLERHESLRTCFFNQEGKSYQTVLAYNPELLRFSWDSMLNLSKKNLRELAHKEAQHVFQLNNAPLLRIRVLENGHQYILMINMHHIIHDGWSFHVFCKELMEIYSALVEKQPIDLVKKKWDYIDFSHWQRNFLNVARQEQLLSYWTEQLADFVPTKLPSDYTSLNRGYAGDRIAFSISKKTLTTIRKISQANQTTLFTTLFSAFSILISQYTSQKDLVIGTPISGRHYPNLETMIGFFVNILILRADLQGDPSFQDLLLKNKEMILNAYQHQDLPFENVISALNPTRGKGENPLASIMFIFQNYPVVALQLPGVSCQRILTDNESLLLADYESAKVDLSLYLQETTKGLQALFEYNTQLFHRTTIERLITQFQNLLQIISATPSLKISKIVLLDEMERDQLSMGLSAKKKDYPIHLSLCTLLQQQFARVPNKTALSFAGQMLTYRQLNETANQLASHLLALGLRRQEVVGIYLERSFELMIGLLALWKVGAIPVCIDPNYPKGRVQFIINDCQAVLLLTQSSFHNDLTIKLNQGNGSANVNNNLSIVDLDKEWPAVTQQAKKNLTLTTSSEDVLYIIYTSGSTGHPKGVPITQQGVINMAYAQIDELGLQASDRILQFARFTFDAFFWETLGAWLASAQLCLVTSEIKLVGHNLLQILKTERITVATLTPSVVETIPEGAVLPHLRYLVLAGEAASLSLVEKWSRQSQVINAYGPTEASICSSLEKVDLANGKLGIGRPLANVEIYVLDAHFELVPVGTSGEIYLGGVGVARGYLNQPELTQKSFLRISLNGKLKRLYKTGDRGRWLIDGRLEYLGRIENDQQIKLRGLRIEKEEIKQHILKHPAIANAAVIVNEQHLVAYLVVKPSIYSEKNTYLLHIKDQTQQWQKLYDHLYQRLDVTRPINFNCLGWNSSYTKKPFLEEEMQEWIDTTVQRIMTLKPKRVLEIGCGAGLLMTRIAPHCDFYMATDFSTAAINYLAKLKDALNLQRVRVLQRFADDFGENEKDSYDVIIINSVIQYFPDIEQLILVMERAIVCLQPGGKLFIGDIRSLAHLEMFHHKLMQPATKNKQTLAIKLAENIDHEEELLVQANFFEEFAENHVFLDCAITQLRRGKNINEMTQFRYDAILYKKGPNPIPRLQIDWLKWGEAFTTLETMKKHLVNQSPQYLAIQGIPNARLLISTEKIDEMPMYQAENPEVLFHLAETLAYQVLISWSKQDPVNLFDIVFYRSDQLAHIFEHVHIRENQLNQEDWLHYANQPQKNKIKQVILIDLKKKIKEVVPDYMVPANWHFIKEMPLTLHGKTDEKLLQSLDLKKECYILDLSSTDIEKRLSLLWKSCLNTDRLGTNTNFFDIGGESLRAVELISIINEAFRINLPINVLIDAPTIKKLAPKVENQLKQAKIIEASINSVVLLKESSNGLPLFLIPGVGGTVFCYEKLIKNLTFSGPCYAIQDPSITLEKILFSSLEEMAACYIKLIKTIQLKGPYKIAGHSFGGMVAVEIARQLQQSGDDIQLVALFDTWASTRSKDKLNVQVKETLTKQYKTEKQNEYSAQFFQSKPIIDLSFWIKLGQHRMGLGLNYQVPSALAFPLVLFKAEESIGKALNNQDSPTNYWDRYSSNLQVYNVRGYHESMLRCPFVKTTAILFDRCLDVDCKQERESICLSSKYSMHC